MPEKRMNARHKCRKCKKVYDENQEKCKVCRCKSVTYCSEECQTKDWPRHIDNHIPVMVKDYGEKGKGLVASKAIKMGELILTDQAVVSNDDIKLEIYGYAVTSDAERLLINQRILKDISLLNHSCAPNAAMGLLDGELNREPEKRFELRAIKDISKEDEVTIFHPRNHDQPLYHNHIREVVKKDFGFDCKCSVCSGEVPNQDAIMEQISKILLSIRRFENEDEMTFSDWTRRATGYGVIVDLAGPVYMGRPEWKMAYLLFFLYAAKNARKPILLNIKELAEKTGLEVFKKRFQKFYAMAVQEVMNQINTEEN